MRRLLLLLVVVALAGTARAETELVPAFPDAIRGPAAAHGAVIWNHGLSQTEADRILTERGVPHLIIDQPAVIEGHGVGASVYFAKRFGPCWLAAAETGRVPALASCETRWGESPSADLRVPADLAVTPGGLAGKWYGNYTNGREEMLIVTRIDGAAAQGMLVTGATNGAGGSRAQESGQAIGGGLVFAGANKPTLTLTPALDGSAGLLWVSADEKSRLGAVLHRVP